MKTLILFDLDGTLVNTAEGITRSVQYALKHFGMTETDQKKMERFIGPPLLESFQREYGFSEEKSNQAIKIYRERYAKKGVYECELYPEVKATLQILKEKGIRLGVASSKPERFCKKILEYLQIAQYFEVDGVILDLSNSYWGGWMALMVLQVKSHNILTKLPGVASGVLR